MNPEYIKSIGTMTIGDGADAEEIPFRYIDSPGYVGYQAYRNGVWVNVVIDEKS